MQIFRLSRKFPPQERYALTGQILRSSRGVCGHTGEAWGKRIYPKTFCSKLSDAEGEVEETRVWLDFAVACRYITDDEFDALEADYRGVVRQLVNMRTHPEQWAVRRSAS